jgi:hypothetical protein
MALPFFEKSRGSVGFWGFMMLDRNLDETLQKLFVDNLFEIFANRFSDIYI